ncbi:hypothetical protein HMI55_000291, partial [Coelomomyces lativittatus]
SPWSNQFDPKLSDGILPSPSLRKLEEEVNAAFEVYLDLYYEGGLSSVYMWDVDFGFACVVLIQKHVENGNHKECWDSIHVFEVNEGTNKNSHYKLTSTVLLSILNEITKKFELAGSITRQNTHDFIAASHLVNLGQMVEDMEFKLRELLKTIYFEKTRDVFNELRSFKPSSESDKKEDIKNELMSKLAGRKVFPMSH